MYLLSSFARFHTPQIASALAQAGVQVDLQTADPGVRVGGGYHVGRGIAGGQLLFALNRLCLAPTVSALGIHLFDEGVARHIEHAPARGSVFHGFSLYCRQSLNVARKNGIACAVERSGAHVRAQRRLLQEEAERLGIKPRRAYYESSAALERMLAEYDAADRIIVSSSFARDTFIAEGIPSEKLEVIGLGMNYPVRGWQPRSLSPFRVLSIGNEVIRKGVADLLEAWHLADLPDSILQVRSPMIRAWKALIYGTKRPVEVLPQMDHAGLSKYFSGASVFCLLSIEDGFGLVVAEAMSFGCPVIVSRNVGAKDMVQDGKDGFVVDIRSPEQVAAKLAYLRENPDVLQEMSKMALAKAHEFGWDKYASRLVQMWSQMPGGRIVDA